jgi:predicted ATPase
VPNNLPHPQTSFVGRDPEIAAVRRLLAASRLVTLTGAGGCGKSRLAREVAAGLLAEFPDGVGWVELASVIEPFLIPCHVAQALGVREQPGRPLLETLRDHVSERKALLVLDGADPLPSDVADLVGALLESPSNLRILVTSREPLGAADEAVWPVPPLSLPAEAAAAESASDAVSLFVERAAATLAGCGLTEANAALIARLCRLLDGVPLAIELAAAGAGDLPLEAMAAALEDRHHAVSPGAGPALHEAVVHAMLEWSYLRLPRQEAMLLRRLSVFANDWTLAAARIVCARGGIPERTVPPLLKRLRERSLIAELPERQRWTMPGPVRQYVGQRLRDSREHLLIQRLHRDWCLSVAEWADSAHHASSEGRSVECIEAEQNNMRAAIRWSIERRDAIAALRLGNALHWIWEVQGQGSEEREWLTAILALYLSLSYGMPPGSVHVLSPGKAMAIRPSPAEATIRSSSEFLESKLGSSLVMIREAAPLLGLIILEFLLLFLTSGPHSGWARGLTYLWAFWAFTKVCSRGALRSYGLYCAGQTAMTLRDYALARLCYRKSLAIEHVFGIPRGIVARLHSLGNLALQEGDYAAARVFYEKTLAIARKRRWKSFISAALANLGAVYHYEAQLPRYDHANSLIAQGNVAYSHADYEAARAHYQESLLIWQDLREPSGTAAALGGLGNVALSQGDFATAHDLYEKGLTIAERQDDRRLIGYALSSLGLLAYLQGNRADARRFLEQGLSIARESGEPECITSRLINLGLVSLEGNCPTAAARLFGEALEIARAAGEREWIAASQAGIARVALLDGNVKAARSLYQECLRMHTTTGTRGSIAHSLEALAAVAAGQGQSEKAARLWGAAQALREAIGAPLPPVDVTDYEHSVEAARSAAGESSFAAAWAAGRALALEQAIAEALEEENYARR